MRKVGEPGSLARSTGASLDKPPKRTVQQSRCESNEINECRKR